MKKRLLSLLLVLAMVLTFAPMAAMAAGTDITVYVTVNNGGTLAVGTDAGNTVMANVPVTVETSSGSATVDDVLSAVHALYRAGGYATAETDFGKSVTKLWGTETTNTLMFVNGAGIPVGVGVDTVSDGDKLYASVNADNTNWADWYAYFDKTEVTVLKGEAFDLTLKGFFGMAYTEEDKTPAAIPAVSVGTADKDGFHAIAAKTTGEDGVVSLSFDEAGTYIVSAQGTVKDMVGWSEPKTEADCPIMAPFCLVTVKEPVTETIDFYAAKNDGTFIITPQEMTVTQGVAAAYGFNGNVDGVSYLDALVAAHVLKYGESFTKETAKDYLKASAGYVTKAFADAENSLCFMVNGETPADEAGTGYTVEEALLKTGDVVCTYLMDFNASYGGDYYTKFDAYSKTVKTGEEFTLTLSGYMAMAQMYGASAQLAPINGGAEDAALTVNTVNSDGTLSAALKDGAGSELAIDANGQVKLSFGTAGTYIVTVNGFAEDTLMNLGAVPVIAPYCVVTVEFDIPVVDGSDDSAVPEGGYTYNVGDTAAELKANISAADGINVTKYQWRYKTSPDTETSSTAGTSTLIKKATFTPKTETDSLKYYFCRITYTLDSVESTFDTALVPVKVIASSAQTPVLNMVDYDTGATLKGGTYLQGSTAAAALNVKAASSDGGKLSYKWFSKTGDGEYQEIDGAAASSYVPVVDTLGTTTYYCEVTNTLKSVSGKTYKASVTSDEADVIVQSAAEYGAGWEGTGTETDPYLLKTADDLTRLADICNNGKVSFAGKYFLMDADITLPAQWIPVGTAANRFSGSIDGGNRLLTIPEGEKTLIGCPKEAELKNLNIYGTKINGSGVVSIYTTGVKGYTAITIDNVTLKSGSSTLMSGFVGGYAPGDYPVIIRNSTVESGVIIGYDGTMSNIGSFGGDFNGLIEGCVSGATVKGVNYVGGISGSKGQTMGDYVIRDCIFSGEVQASGNYAGGVSGGGYGGTSWGLGSGPNTPCATIQNCFVTGSVTGANYVGGILGAEPGVKQCWTNGVGYVQNNFCSGTVTATAGEGDIYAGGVIGYLNTLDRYQIISNNYYLEASAAKGIGAIGTVLDDAHYGRMDDPTGADADKLTKAGQAADSDLVAALNSGLNGSGCWKLDGGEIGFAAQRHLVSVSPTPRIITGTSEAIFKQNETDKLSSYELLLTYSDGSTETISINLATVSGLDFSKTGCQLVSIIYNNHQYAFGVNMVEGGTPSDPGAVSTDITVKFTLLGDSVHSGGTVHTLKANNLTTWISQTSVTLEKDSTVLDALTKVLNSNRYSWMNDGSQNGTNGNYIESITTADGVKLEEFTNGSNSGWMYTLNGSYPALGVSEQTLKNGDVIVFHYTDDYTIERASDEWNGGNSGGGAVTETAVAKTERLINAIGTVTKSSESAIKAARAAYDGLSDAQKKLVGNYDALTAAEEAYAKLTGNSADFTDVPNDAYFHDAVMWAANNGITKGKDEKTFAPDEVCTRAQAVTFIWRAAGSPEPKSGETKFTDLEEGSFYYDAVLWAVENNIVNGTSDTEFSPDESVTRAQIVTLLWRFAKSPAAGAANAFEDVQSGSFYAEAVRWAIENSVTNGTSGTTFSPDDDCIRADIVTFLFRHFVK